MKRKMNKYLEWLSLCMILVSLFLPRLSEPAHAEEEPCWVLQEVVVNTFEDKLADSFKLDYLDTTKYIKSTLIYKEYGDVRVQIVHPSVTFDAAAHASQLPNSFRPGDTLTINYDFDIQADVKEEVWCYLSSGGEMWLYSIPEDFVPREFGKRRETIESIDCWNLRADYDINSYRSFNVRVGVGDQASFYDDQGTDIYQNGSRLSATIPEGQEGQMLWICVDYSAALWGSYRDPSLGDIPTNGGHKVVQEEYTYIWTATTDQEGIVDAGNGPGEIGEEIDSGIINPGTIAKVGGGAAAAVIGFKVIKGVIGKSGGKGKKKKRREDEPEDEPQDEQKDEDEKKSYEMRIYKEFGDTIYAGRTVTVGARIVEISTSGVERTVPDLTQKITISSNDLQVGGTFLSGQYQSARVTAPDCDEMSPSTALVTFSLVAPGGSFTQHMRFKIKQAAPMVVWPDLQRGMDPYLEIIAGDNVTYPVRFFFDDVDQEPEKIVFGQYDDYEITVEPADTMYTYWAMVKNRTAPLDKQRIYQHVSCYPSGMVRFTATFKDGMELKGCFKIIHYPEGLSVVANLKDGRIPVQAYERESYGGLEGPYPGTALNYTCARRTESGAEIFQPQDVDLRYGELQGDRGEADNNVAMKYPFRAGVWSFDPQKTLYEPTPGATYLMKIDVVWKEDPNNPLTLPLTFKLKPKSPKEEWQKEFEKLKQSVIIFAPDEDLPKNVARLKHLTPENSSPNELYLMTKAIWNAYIEYWENEYNRQMNIDESLKWWVDKLGWVKFFGDCAFSYLIYYFATTFNCTTAAPYIDAIGSAGKDIFCSLGGRYIGAWWNGEELYLDGFIKECTEAAKSALDDCIFEMIPDNPKAFFKSPSIKKVGTVVAAYMLVNFAMNLAKIRFDMDDPEEKAKLADMSDEARLEETSWSNSIYGALIASFKDMSLRMITSIVGDSIEKYLDNPDMRKRIGNFIISIFDLWWKGEKKLMIVSRGTQKWVSRISKQLYQFKALRSERLEKLAYGLRNCRSLYERSQSFNAWKQKSAQQITDILDKIPEEAFAYAASKFFGKKEMKNYVLSRKGNILPKSWVSEKALQGGVIMDKIILKGTGYVYDLTTGELVGLKKDLDKEDEALVAAGEMDERVMEKRVQEKRAEKQAEELRAVISKLTADIENAETPEAVEDMIDQFLEQMDLPDDVADVEEEEADDYAFDPTPEFKLGPDGCMYVVMILRKPGTNKGYRIEYNLNKVFADGLDNEVFVEFFKLFFGGVLPDFPEKKAPIPANPPLPSELK